MGKLINEYEILSCTQQYLSPSADVLEIDKSLAENPDCGDLWMKRGRALSKERFYHEALKSHSKAIALDPFNGDFYRYRAHCKLGCYLFEDACADFVLASRLIPFDWGVWYHLGLSFFLLQEYEKAKSAYDRCYELSFDGDNEKELAAISNWYWIILQKLGKAKEAQTVLNRISEEMDPGPNKAYYELLKVYKGVVTPESLLASYDERKIDYISKGFGIANYYEHVGNRAKSDEVLSLTLNAGKETGIYYAFGCMAAVVETEIREERSRKIN